MLEVEGLDVAQFSNENKHNSTSAMDQANENAHSENGEVQQRQQGIVRPRQMSISSDEVNYLIYRYVLLCRLWYMTSFEKAS